MRGVIADRRMNTNESVVKTTMRVKECTAQIQNREQVRSQHFEPPIRDMSGPSKARNNKPSLQVLLHQNATMNFSPFLVCRQAPLLPLQ